MRAALLLFVLLAPTAAASASPFSVDIAMTEKWAKPQTVVVFPANVTNEAEEPIKLWFEVASKKENLQVPIPNPVALQGASGATRAIWIPFVVQTPYRNGHMDEEGTVTYRATARHPETGSAIGEPHEFTLTVHTKGFYVPGPQLFGAMLALGLAALFLRRRAA